MRRGKYAKKRHCKIHKGKILLLTLVLILDIAAGSTTAFLVSKSGPKENTFKESYVACEVLEEFDEINKTDVKVKNTGDTESYIRAAIVVTWKDAHGKVYPKAPKKGEDYVMTLPANEWFEAIDRFYYYKYPVAPDDSTKEALISVCHPVAGTEPEGYVLSVEILASAIQSQPATAVEESWGVTVNPNREIHKTMA